MPVSSGATMATPRDSAPPSAAARVDDASLAEIAALLKRTMPFQVSPERLLLRVAQLARRESFGPGRTLYQAGDPADDLFVIVSGRVEHDFDEIAQAKDRVRIMTAGEVFGWAALLEGQPGRLARATTLDRTEVLRIDGEQLVALLSGEPSASHVVMTRFATLINRNFAVPETIARVRGINIGSTAPIAAPVEQATGLALTMVRLGNWTRSPRPYLMLIGFALMLGFWYLAVEVWKLPRFAKMPGLTTVVKEWLNPDPVYGLSVYTSDYYIHIWSSIRRVAIAFFLATALGVPLGLLLGWSRKFREYVFPVFETLRPIPILAWVPLSILMFKYAESPVIFLTFLASFFATALNTMLGVQSIDESYTRAASCLGASKWHVFRHVIVPGALPFIFTGLQISIGVAWFSLVAAEMVSGQYGLGYVINTSYTDVKYPTIVIGMLTLGAVGYITSAMVRIVGDHLMQWRVRELALGGR